MKVMLLTFSFNYNYGAVLQAYATVKALESLGCEVVLPSYVPDYLKGNASKFRGLGVRSNGVVKALKKRASQWSRYKEFEGFRKQFLPFDNSLSSKDIISESLVDIDAVIVGSDQTFNTSWMNGFEDFFFQGFFDNNETKKISYASCFGRSDQPEENLPKIKDCLDGFNSLSVRNIMSSGVVEKLLDKKPSIVVDPTILYDFSSLYSDKWAEEKDIILVYSLDPENLETGRNISKELKDKHGSEIVFVNGEKPHEIAWADTLRNDVGPLEWIELFKTARFIVTDSFHGCVFATKFKKNFIPYTQGWRAGRLQYFLSGCGLEDMLVTEYKKGLATDWSWEGFDFEAAKTKIDQQRQSSIEYLAQALGRVN